MNLAEKAYESSERTVYVLMRSPGGADADMSESFLVFTDKEKCRGYIDKIESEKTRLFSHSLPGDPRKFEHENNYDNKKHLIEILNKYDFSSLKEALTFSEYSCVDIEATFRIEEAKLIT